MTAVTLSNSPDEKNVTLEVRSMTRRFGGLIAVNEVSFDVRRGEIFGLIGPNGAGKTTLFNLMTGLTPPSSGSLSYEGRDVTNQAPHKIAALGMARTFQNIDFSPIFPRSRTSRSRSMSTRKAVFGMACLACHPRRSEEKTVQARAYELLELVGLAGKASDQAQEFFLRRSASPRDCAGLGARAESLVVGRTCGGHESV